MMIMKKIRHMHRYREIATALAKFGFGYIIKEVGLFHLLSLPKIMTADLNGNAKPLGKRLRLLMEDLGPTFIKLGQLLSIRRDLIPGQLTEELEKLQDDVRPINSTVIKHIIEQELGASCDDLFDHFDEQCLAAASIGQVHRAVLKTGEDVVVKVRRPKIEIQVEHDIEILRDLAHLIEQHYNWAKHYQIRDIVDELATAIRSEMDYSREGRNTEKIKKQFENNDKIIIPSVYWEYSTKKVLTTAYIDGKKFSELAALPHDNFDKKVLADRLVHSFLNQVLINGFYHGDPHPGNIFFLPENKIAYIDFGQVGMLTNNMKQNFAGLVIGLMRKNTDLLVQTVRQMAVSSDDIDENKLKRDLDELRDRYANIPLSEINIGNAIADLFNVTQRYRITIPKDYTLLGKALMTIESIITDLDSDLSMIQLAQPYGKKMVLERLNPKNALTKLWQEVTGITEVIFELPHQLKSTLTNVNKGKAKFEMNIPQIDKLLLKLDRVGNRLSFSITLLAFSIVIVGLIIGATFGNSFLAQIPAIEIGFVIAFLMFLLLIYSIIRSGRF
ncbi:2-octaprenylphenol hydroxylase [Scopulibacillus darangshiensis]|uniref:2-octaprenylphenol hydroxylase n=1 Tax=Scopulibacillus darangshiensis TaxID=442528 RepID=A0A4R2P597_9BACL|nr:AarF/ABC1/UbiB kinase family protein [Scopulibacillus darangshiensis]TCP30020.1 2-octaprenylphenol hydroxylase [Scopulibacillus darangshiensis]